MRPPIFTTYKGETYTLGQLESRLRIGYTTLRRWRDAGVLCEATIDAHLALMEERRRSREDGRRNAVPDSTRRMRIARGWSREAAALDWRDVLP